MTAPLNWFLGVSPLVWAGVLVVGAILLVLLGLRGRRVGREPRCRRCGYELTGLTSSNCPECGRVDVLKRPRIGVRRRRWGWFVGAAALVCAAGYPFVSSGNWRSVAPLQLLMTAMDFGDLRSAAVVDRRVLMGEVSESGIESLIERALDVQQKAPLKSARMEGWGTVLATLDLLNFMSDAQWERMMRQSLREFRVRLRERTRVGDRIPYTVDYELAAPRGWFLTGKIRVSVAGSSREGARWNECVLWGDHSFAGTVEGARPLIEHDLPVGVHDVEFEFRGSLLDTNAVGKAFAANIPRRYGGPTELRPTDRKRWHDKANRVAEAALTTNPAATTELPPYHGNRWNGPAARRGIFGGQRRARHPATGPGDSRSAGAAL